MHVSPRPCRALTVALAFCALAFAASSTLAQSVIASIPVGRTPVSADVNTTTNKIYVANSGDNNISVIDGATNTVTATISGVNTYTFDLAVNSVTNKIYMTGIYSGNVIVIDGATNGVVKTIFTGAYPWRIAINPVTNRIYVANANTSTISVIDGASDSIITDIPLPNGSAYAPAVNTATNKIYVVNGSNSVNVIDGATNTITATIPVGASPQKLAVNSATNRIYVANYNSLNVSVINGATNTVIATIPTSGNPFGVGIDAATSKVLVANQTGAAADPVDIISGASNSTVASFNVGNQPSSVAVNSLSRRAYITNQDSGTVSVISLPNDIVISEFRFHGASGGADEFVELANTSAADLTVSGADGSAGWALVGADGVVRATIPNGTVVPRRGHLLLANSTAYSLSSAGGASGAADLTYTQDIPDDSGVALFLTQNPANFNAGTRSGAVGFSPVTNSLYREGIGISGFPSTDGEYSFVRKLNNGTPQDTGNNAADFSFVSNGAGIYGGMQSVLGAPGPENLASPVLSNDTIKVSLIDSTQASTAPPNRVRSGQIQPGVPNAFGTLSIQRRFKNATPLAVTRLRFRIVDITTLGSPAAAGGPQADMRVLSSTGVVTNSQGQEVVTVTGLTLETPPPQPNGGGLNSTLTVALPGGALAPGNSIDVQFLLGVQQGGNFRFLVNVEALTDPSSVSAGSERKLKTGGAKATSGSKQK